MTSTIVANGDTLDQSGVISFNTIELQGTSANTDLILTASATLNNAGTILLAGPFDRVYSSPTGSTLDNVNGTIEGQGELGINSSGFALAVTNESGGLIDADGTAALTIATGTLTAPVTNSGLIEATTTGGLVLLSTTFLNTGTIGAFGAGAAVDAAGSDIVGGTLADTGGGIIDVINDGESTLDGSNATDGPITITTGSTVEEADGEFRLVLLGTIDNLGTIATGTTNGADLVIGTTVPVTLTGGGILDLVSSTGTAAAADARVLGNSGTGTLVNVNNLIEGAGDLGINSGGFGLALTNESGGTIDANAALGLNLETGGPTVTNSGLIEATGTGGLTILSTTISNSGTIGGFGAGATVVVQSSDISGGTLATGSGGGVLFNAGESTLDGTSGITIATGSTITASDSVQLLLIGTIDNLGMIDNGTTNGANFLLGTVVPETLTGDGVLDLVGNGSARIYGNSGTATLVNLNNTIEGAGQLGINSGSFALALTNDATIDANGTAGIIIAAGGPAVTNDDLIEATATGGLTIESTTISNSGTLGAFGAGATLNLQSADIVGGTLADSSGGITIAAGSTLTASDSVNLLLVGTIDNLGTIFNGTTNGANFLLGTAVAETLTGDGVLDLVGNGSARIYGNSGTATLVNLNNLIEGAGQLGIDSGSFALALTNDATIDANGTAGMIIATGGPAVTNNDLIEATTTGGLTIESTTISNFGTLGAFGAGAAFDVGGSDIIGGTLADSGGGVVNILNFGESTLDGSNATNGPITITTGSTVVAADGGDRLLLQGTIDNLGTILDGTTSGADLLISPAASVILTGGGVLDLVSNGTTANARVFGNSALGTLINVSNTIEGAGQLGINSGSFALALTNDSGGTIDANGVAALDIELDGPTFANAGLLEASGSGGFYVASTTFTNTGTVAALNGSHGSFASSATITNNTGGTLTGGTWEAISTGAAASLILSGGTVAVDAATIEVSGTAATLTAGGVGLDAKLTSIAATGTLQLLADYNFTDPNTVSDSGYVQLGGGLFSTEVSNNLTIASGGTFLGFGTIEAEILANAGLLESSGGTLQVTPALTVGSFGTVEATDGSDLSATSSVINLSSGTLTGGTWEAISTGDGAGIFLAGFSGLVTDAATIVLSGINSNLEVDSQAIDATLGSIASSGTLELLAGRNFTDPNALTDSGYLELGGGALGLSNGLSLTSTGTLLGFGTVNANISGNGTIESGPGTLDLTGSVAGGPTFIIDPPAPSDLKFDGTATAASAISITGSNQTLEIGAAGNLTIAVAESITKGTIQLDGGTLADGAGITLGSGANLTGAGTVNAPLSGSGTVTASGGTLDLTGSVSGGPTLVVGTIGAQLPDLKIDGVATAQTSVSISAGGQLEIGTVGYLLIEAAETVVNGAIIGMDGGTLVDSAGITLEGTSTDVDGAGTIAGAVTFSGGDMIVVGGLLDLHGAVTGSVAASGLQIDNASSTLELDGSVGAGVTITFPSGAAVGGELILTDFTGQTLTGFNGTVAGLNTGTSGTVPTTGIDLRGITPGDITAATISGDSLIVMEGAATVASIALIADPPAYVDWIADGHGGTEVFLSTVPCFCPGTRILAADGEVAVEALAIGDRVVTLSGAIRPIKWIGRRNYDGRFISGNRAVLPIVVKAGALADGVPVRDLYLSPHHALFLDGVLVPAEHLVNGVSVVQMDAVESVEYFHIELDSHDLILAEGAPAETFVDCDSRGMFQNAAEFDERYPGEAPASWAFCAPRVEAGSALAAVQRRIDARCGLVWGPVEGWLDVADGVQVSGWARDPAAPGRRVALDVLVDGAVVAAGVANLYRPDLTALGIGDGWHGFSLRLPQPLSPDQAYEVRVRREGDTTELSGCPMAVAAA